VALIFDAFLDAAELAADVVCDSRVAGFWELPSALEGYTVGGLAGHLFHATDRLREVLEADPPPPSPPAPIADYYGRARVDSPADLDHAFHRAVRDAGERVAQQGPEALGARFTAMVTHFRETLPGNAPDRLVPVVLGDGRPSRLDDYVATRVVELLVHSDDLAVSAGLPEISMPPTSAEVAIEALVWVPRVRHGDLAVLRALARRERSNAEILRVL
jgi:uncharacterized protein (TIGR03083 family)